MADFKIAYRKTSAAEGGLVNHPSDPGGLTYKGITIRDHKDWPGWKYVDQKAMKVTNQAAIDIEHEKLFKKLYWDTFNGDAIKSQAIADEIFDTGINMGTGIAEIFVQRALNVANKNQTLFPNLKIDGQIGPKTISFLNSHPNPQLILKCLNILQGARYIALCESNEKLEDFIAGWINHRVSV